ncbi:MAG: DNA polymerase III subunit delta' [Shimia sp.]
MSDAPPEPDRIEGVPHPRETERLFGQSQAEAEFLTAWNSGRLHHGWMLAGPQGIGKATLAYRIARFLVSQPPGAALIPPTTLDAEGPDARLVRGGAHPGLYVLRRSVNPKTGTLRQEITVNAFHGTDGEGDREGGLHRFFALSNAEGAPRVVVIDAADELNTTTANALLKILEEPPRGALLLLVTHQPSRLLPTIRSRCRMLRCATLAPSDVARAMEQAGVTAEDPTALAALAGGSVGGAIRLQMQDGVALYAAILRLMSGLPDLDRGAARALADLAGGRDTGKRDLVFDLLDLFLARLARAGAGRAPQPEAAPGEGEVMARLAPHAGAARAWAAAAQRVGGRHRHGRAVNLDASGLLLDTVLKIEAEAKAMTHAAPR